MLPVNTMRDQNANVAGALNRDAIAALIARNPPLVENYVDLEAQLQPNGFDITLQSIAGFSGGVEGAASVFRTLTGAWPVPANTHLTATDGVTWRRGHT